jgi:hypothetical protein
VDGRNERGVTAMEAAVVLHESEVLEVLLAHKESDMPKYC